MTEQFDNLLVGVITEERIKKNARAVSYCSDRGSLVDWSRIDMQDGNSFVGRYLRNDPTYTSEKPFKMAMRQAMSFYKRVQLACNHFNEKKKNELRIELLSVHRESEEIGCPCCGRSFKTKFVGERVGNARVFLNDELIYSNENEASQPVEDLYVRALYKLCGKIDCSLQIKRVTK